MTTDEASHTGCAVRVVNIYAIPWSFNGVLNDDEGEPLDLGGLEHHYALYKEQLPRLLPPRVLSDWRCNYEHDVKLAKNVDGVDVTEARAELYVLPSKQVVLAVTMCLKGGALTDTQQVEPIATVLERCIFGQIMFGSRELSMALPEKLPETLADGSKGFSRDVPGESLLPERHQLVFVSRSAPEQPVPSQQVIDKILYRSKPPYRPEFVDPREPTQLNTPSEPATDGLTRQARPHNLLRRHHQADASRRSSAQLPTRGVITPYASLLYGHRNYVEASIFLSTVHAVGTAARFRYIWRKAYQQVLQFREQNQATDTGKQTRGDLEILADSLGNLEFDLTFSVEFPLLRIETFQSNLYDAMDLSNQAKTLSQMFNQLGGSLKSEITAIEVREQRRTELRKRWNSIAASLLSLIGVPVGFVVAFLGINTTEVPDEVPEKPQLSMWDPHYSIVYLIASSFALLPVVLIAAPYLWGFGESAEKRKSRRALWSGTVAMVCGLSLFFFVILNWRRTGFGQIIEAMAAPLGIFLALVGLILLVACSWRHVRKLFRRNPRKPEVSAEVTQPVPK